MTNQEILDAMFRAHAGAGFEGKGHMLYPWSADAAISDVQELCRLFAIEIQRLTREECAKVCETAWRKGLGEPHQGDVFAVAIRKMRD